MGGAEGVVGCVRARVGVCLNFSLPSACASAVISECHQGRRIAVILWYGGTCITFMGSQSVLKKYPRIDIEGEVRVTLAALRAVNTPA